MQPITSACMRDTSVYRIWVKGQSNHKAHLLHSCSELVSVAGVAIVYSKRMKIGGKQVTVVLLVVFTTLGSYNWLLLGLQPSQALNGFDEQNLTLADYCTIPNGGFKAWSQGVVSVLDPVVSRNCSLLFSNDKNEVERVKTQVKKAGELVVYSNKTKILNYSKNCTWLLKEFSNNFYTSQEEREFPLAFTFVVHQYPQQFIRLLKVIYRPHNIYCIHLDKKASNYSKQYVASVSHCLPNVFTPRRTENVYWAHHSLMDAQMSCFSDLYDVQKVFQWKYVISLCGKELPLRTNREIVRMLKTLDGNSGMDVFTFSKAEEYRVKKKWMLNIQGNVVPTKKRLGPIPHNLKLYKSMIFFSLTPNFVDFLLHNKTAIDFHNFLTNTFIPEENFYASLYMIPGEL